MGDLLPVEVNYFIGYEIFSQSNFGIVVLAEL